MAEKIEAFRLKTDFEIEDYFNNKDYSIYFREGSEGDYELSNQPLDVIIDATTFGFEFIAAECSKDTLKESEVELSDVEKDDIEK